MSKRVADQQLFRGLDASSARFRKIRGCGFVESCASNEQFDKLRNDGRKMVYIAVQSDEMKLAIRCIDCTSLTEYEDSFVMDVVAKDGTKELTCFGTRLSDDGILWMSIFNRNMIIGANLLI
mmetsp:Transcript_1420/g.2312  ORF Transcript_1420/g.2312 Transcript_1420/m.2312 type:complete len:122 (-) Transcript_1420:1080-1445(-)